MQRKATRSQDKFDRHILSFENLIRYAVPRSAKKNIFLYGIYNFKSYKSNISTAVKKTQKIPVQNKHLWAPSEQSRWHSQEEVEQWESQSKSSSPATWEADSWDQSLWIVLFYPGKTKKKKAHGGSRLNIFRNLFLTQRLKNERMGQYYLKARGQDKSCQRQYSSFHYRVDHPKWSQQVSWCLSHEVLLRRQLCCCCPWCQQDTIKGAMLA